MKKFSFAKDKPTLQSSAGIKFSTATGEGVDCKSELVSGAAFLALGM
jgi:hypothetical protein